MSLWNKTDTNLSKPKYLHRGEVVGVNITSGGTDCVSPTVAFSGGGGSGAAATLTVTGGVITEVTITNPGSGYTSAPTATITYTGGGSGASLTPVIKQGNYTDANIVFADNAEASVAANKARGINGPGWWYYTTKVTDGVTRPIAIQLVETSATQDGTTGDASDDTVLADS